MATLAEPLTGNQLGRIGGEWDRLGLRSRKYHRAERLRLTATLAGLGSLESTKDLTGGQAGRVIRMLTECGTLTEVYQLTEPQAGPSPVSPLLAALMACLYQLARGPVTPATASSTKDRNEVNGPCAHSR